MKKGNGISAVIVVIMTLALLGPGIILGADSGKPRCSESEILSKQNVCEPIIFFSDQGWDCPTGYSLEAGDEKRPGSVPHGKDYFYRCIPRQPGMPEYVIKKITKKHPRGQKEAQRVPDLSKYK